MGFNIEIPKELAHLKIDKRGYPVPFFVPWNNGEPDFRYMDAQRLYMIIDNKLCHICGKKLHKDYCYFISGPIGYQNRISSDAGMHRICAEFSLKACPHLYLQKAERRENDEVGKLINSKPSPIIKEKPSTLLLIKASKFKIVLYEGQKYLRYTPVSAETFHYVNGKLKKQ
jgi:hypothetical protein